MWNKLIWGIVVPSYFIIGFGGGLLLAAAIPAMNFWGVTYYALTWPAFVYCAKTNCDVMPPVSISRHFYTDEE